MFRPMKQTDIFAVGVIVTRKTHLQEPSVSVSKQVNIAERESFSQSFHTSSVEEEKNVTSPRNSSQAQLSTKVAQEAPIASDAEKGLEGSFAVFKGNISANMSSGPEKGLLNSNFTERQQNILPGLPSRPPLSVLGHRSLPGIPGLNKTNETNKESSQK